MIVCLSLGPRRQPSVNNVWFETRKSLSVVWSPVPAYYTYGTVQGYQVEYYEADGNPQQAKMQRTAGTSIQIEGLKDFTNYCITVSAFNEHGLGKYSEPRCHLTDEGGEKEKITLTLMVSQPQY